MAVEYSKVAAQVQLLELLLKDVKQALESAGKREPSSFMQYKGALKGWLNADDDLLEECRLRFEDPGKVN